MGIFVLVGLISEGVTVHNPGIRLELFLRELSAQSGGKFECAPALKNEVLAVSFEDQPVEEVRTQLGRVIHGSWEIRNNAWFLTQTSSEQAEERKWNIEQHKAAYAYRLSQLASYAPKTEWTAVDAEQFVVDYQKFRSKSTEAQNSAKGAEQLMMRSPSNRLNATIAAYLKPEMFPLEGLDRENPRFSPTPLPSHFKLPISVQGALQRFQVESQLYESATGKKRDSWQGAVNMEVRTSGFEQPEFTLYLYDQNWRYVTSCWASLDVNNEVFKAKAESFPLSPETQAMVDFSDHLSEDRYDRTLDGGYKANPLYKKACQVYFNATQTDPLGLIQGACWVDYAKSQGRPLIVNLEEDVYLNRPHLFVPTEEQDPLSAGMVRVDADGWVMGRPRNPLYNRTWRLDRAVVEEFSKLVASPNFTTLESQIKADDLGRQCYMEGMGVPNEQFLIGYDYRGNGPFCLLGTLTSDQLRKCLAGEDIPTTQMNPRAKGYLYALMQNGNLDNLSPLIGESEQSTPAFCYPDGLPTMTLGATWGEVELFSFSDSPTALGRSLEGFKYDLKQALGKDPGLSGQKITTWKARQLTAVLKYGTRKEIQSAEDLGHQGAKTYTWDTLPDETKRKLLAAVKGIAGNG